MKERPSQWAHWRIAGVEYKVTPADADSNNALQKNCSRESSEKATMVIVDGWMKEVYKTF